MMQDDDDLIACEMEKLLSPKFVAGDLVGFRRDEHEPVERLARVESVDGTVIQVRWDKPPHDVVTFHSSTERLVRFGFRK